MITSLNTGEEVDLLLGHTLLLLALTLHRLDHTLLLLGHTRHNPIRTLPIPSIPPRIDMLQIKHRTLNHSLTIIPTLNHLATIF